MRSRPRAVSGACRARGLGVSADTFRCDACRLTLLCLWGWIFAVVRRVAVMASGHRVIIFGFLPQNVKMMAVAVALSMAWRGLVVEDGLSLIHISEPTRP